MNKYQRKVSKKTKQIIKKKSEYLSKLTIGRQSGKTTMQMKSLMRYMKIFNNNYFRKVRNAIKDEDKMKKIRHN